SIQRQPTSKRATVSPAACNWSSSRIARAESYHMKCIAIPKARADAVTSDRAGRADGVGDAPAVVGTSAWGGGASAWPANGRRVTSNSSNRWDTRPAGGRAGRWITPGSLGTPRPRLRTLAMLSPSPRGVDRPVAAIAPPGHRATILRHRPESDGAL